WVARTAEIDFASLDASARIKLVEEAERVKCALSSEEETVFRAPFYDGLHSLEVTVSRAAFEKIASPWISRTLRHCRQALADATLNASDLQAVVLVGGSTRIPAVREAVAECFGREPDVSQHP